MRPSPRQNGRDSLYRGLDPTRPATPRGWACHPDAASPNGPHLPRLPIGSMLPACSAPSSLEPHSTQCTSRGSGPRATPTKRLQRPGPGSNHSPCSMVCYPPCWLPLLQPHQPAAVCSSHRPGNSCLGAFALAGALVPPPGGPGTRPGASSRCRHTGTPLILLRTWGACAASLLPGTGAPLGKIGRCPARGRSLTMPAGLRLLPISLLAPAAHDGRP